VAEPPWAHILYAFRYYALAPRPASFKWELTIRLALPRLGVFHEVELQFEQKMPKMREFFDIFNDNGKYIVRNGPQEEQLNG
jgi:hypothetical protein